MNQDNFIELNKLARNFAAGFSKISKDYEVTVPSMTAHYVLIKPKIETATIENKQIVVYIYSRTEVIVVTPEKKVINPIFKDLDDLLSQVHAIALSRLKRDLLKAIGEQDLSKTIE